MAGQELERRVAALERQVQRLIKSNSAKPRSKDWHRSIGMFAGNDLMKEIDAAGKAIRDRERRQVQRRNSKKRSRARS
jgi:hypothetical protein